jgi:multiple sugar transport system substrate-binding protein
MMRRTVLAVLVLLLVISFAAVATGTEETTEEEAITLRYTDWDSVDRWESLRLPAAEAFMERHPNVTVNYEVVPSGGAQSYNEKILTDIAAGTPADVFMIDMGQLPKFTGEDVLLNLMPYMRRSTVPGGTLAAFNEHIIDIWSTSPNYLAAIPQDNTMIVMFYNKPLFDEAGVEYPDPLDWTWEEYAEKARQLTMDTDGDGKVDQWGTHFMNWLPGFIPFIWMNGGDVVSPDGKQALGYLNSPETAEAIDFLVGLRREGVSPSTEAIDAFGSTWGVFNSGKIGMFFNGTWSSFGFQDAGLYEDIGVAMLPHPAGKEPVTVTYGTGFGVPANAEQKDLAAELAIYLGVFTAPINAQAGGTIPALESARQEIPDFIAAFAAKNFSYALPTLGLRTRFWKPLIETEVTNAVEAVLLGGEEVDEALSDAAANIEAGMTE